MYAGLKPNPASSRSSASIFECNAHILKLENAVSALLVLPSGITKYFQTTFENTPFVRHATPTQTLQTKLLWIYKSEGMSLQVKAYHFQ